MELASQVQEATAQARRTSENAIIITGDFVLSNDFASSTPCPESPGIS